MSAPLTFDDVLQKLQAKFPKEVLGKEDTKPDPCIKIDSNHLHAIILHLRDHLQFETLACLSGIDYPKIPAIGLAYNLFSYAHKLMICVKVYLPREEMPKIRSIVDIYKGANWMERETYDLIGVNFEGHPDLRRILLPPDWLGHPLRKDYVTPDYYNGMPVPLYFEETQQ